MPESSPTGQGFAPHPQDCILQTQCFLTACREGKMIRVSLERESKF
ncbi:hypothetical protein FKM82_016248 [Ascaphus truei]